MKKPILILTALLTAWVASAQNPFLPLWEYIPDGEPHVFEDPDKPGEYRLYLYGSHDSRITDYCGRELIVWSAPTDNLNDWRYDGIIFQVSKDRDGNLLNDDGKGDVLMAPDIVEILNPDGTKTYYLYPNNVSPGRETMVTKGSRPDGPFEVINWSKEDPRATTGIIGFDPGVFIDDDGRIYAYWGFMESNVAELDPETMATLKPGTEIHTDYIPSFKQDEDFRFFEASSMRKIKDKYVLIYSRFTNDGEFDLPIINYTLAYAYGDTPTGPFTYGGTIIDGRARGVDENGKVIPTASPFGNTHGSICEIDGQWWVFYHRQTGTNEYSRQAMVAPIEVVVEEGPGGKVLISEGEYTSEGFTTSGLNPLYKTPAGLACYHVGPQEAYSENYLKYRPYIKPTYFDPKSTEGPFNQKEPFNPVTNITSGSVVGYKYFDFSKLKDYNNNLALLLHLFPSGIEGDVTILTGAPSLKMGGTKIGEFHIPAGMKNEMTEFKVPVNIQNECNGKEALYFSFSSPQPLQSICDFYDLQFVPSKK